MQVILPQDFKEEPRLFKPYTSSPAESWLAFPHLLLLNTSNQVDLIWLQAFPDLPFDSTSCFVLPFCTLDKFCFKLATEVWPGFVLKNFFIQKFHLWNSCCLHTMPIKRHQHCNLMPCPWGSLRWLAWILPCTFLSRKQKQNTLTDLQRTAGKPLSTSGNQQKWI